MLLNPISHIHEFWSILVLMVGEPGVVALNMA
ncbi:hypothetical protein Ga0123461_1367 [Mariprofundus aestuarium]|uniref:Uncharacterized protein n=1 Tax=Mariprofundus aestuarium TaxID=1921086 RepID=A0A2K8KY17_MARES|nr:hypothetical protein Ga0123461_1367 [Mariprofundus aestuarium]